MAKKKVFKTRTIKFKGREYRFKTPYQLAGKLGITKEQADFLIKNSKQTYIARAPGDDEPVKFRMADKPTLGREFVETYESPREYIKTVMTGNDKKNLLKISETLPDTARIRVLVFLRIQLTLSYPMFFVQIFFYNMMTTPATFKEDLMIHIRESFQWANIDESGLREIIENDIDTGHRARQGFAEEGIVNMEITAPNTNTTYNYIKSRLRGEALNIKNDFTETLDIKPLDENCVKSYLKNIHPAKKWWPRIDILGNAEGVTINELIEYAYNVKCGCHIYDINKNKIASIKGDSNLKSIIGVAYNGHFTPLKKLVTKNTDALPFSIVEDAHQMAIDLLNIGIKPANVRYKDDRIISYEHEGTEYIENTDFESCAYILKGLGLEEKITGHINAGGLMAIIESKYLTNNINSFLPHNISKSDFMYKGYENDDELKDKELMTTDLGCAYLNELANLPYLIRTDFRRDRVNEAITELKPNYLYIAKPKQITVLMNRTELYTGEHLIYCEKQGIEFEAIEELPCEIVKNEYIQMIEDLKGVAKSMITDECSYRQALKIINNMMRIYIGKFQRSLRYDVQDVDNIYRTDESAQREGISVPLTDEYSLNLKTRRVYYIYNRKPIAIQIKDSLRRTVYKRMLQLKLTNKDIIQVKVDSITFTKRYVKFEPYDVGTWNLEPSFKPIKGTPRRVDISASLLVDDEACGLYAHGNNYLSQQYAGGGKTYKIMNEIIPEISPADSYIVLSPSHATIQEYKQRGFNCNVIQTYQFSNTIPTENIVIFEEVGMMDKEAHDILFKCYLENKRIYAFGDFYQQLPVKTTSPYNSPYYLEMVFNIIDTDWTNRRNDFTSEYYDKLINRELDLVEEVHKYDTDEPEIYIAYRNTTVEKVNKEIMEAKGIADIYEAGIFVRCKVNDLREFNIFNQYLLTLESINDTSAILRDKVQTYEIPIRKYNKKNFAPAYCVNTYAIQGKTISSYKYIKDDDEYLKTRAGVAYTVISRIKK